MIIDPLLVKSINLRKKQDGNPYLKLSLVKKSGEECVGVIWDDIQENKDKIREGFVYLFEADEGEYQGITQYTIYAAAEDKNADLTEFMEPCPIDVEQVWGSVVKYASSVTYAPYRNIIKAILTDPSLKPKFALSPVTYNLYYSYPGGLIHYWDRCFKWAESLCLLSENINKDLLFAAIFLHNVGKVNEFEPSGAVFRQTLKGGLLGYIPLSLEIFDAVVKEKGYADMPEILKLKHCIVASRGSKAQGSPVDPKTQEASLLVKVIHAVTEIGYYEAQTPQEDGWSEFDAFRKRRNYLG
jgi:3'-5' exoribonuclease